jgi:hypothetical protein
MQGSKESFLAHLWRLPLQAQRGERSILVVTPYRGRFKLRLRGGPRSETTIRQGFPKVYHWIMLATRWRRDGTPLPDRRFFSALLNGDPLAFAYLGAIIIGIAVCARRRASSKR